MNKILITGGMGFIGSNLVNFLIKKGYSKRIIIVDNLSNSKNKKYKNIKFFKLDCSKKKELEKLYKYKINIIFHIAASSSGENSFYKTEKDMRYNLLATLNLLELAKKNKSKKFIFTSTMSVYGDPAKVPVDERVLKAPKSFYAIHKSASEEYIKIFSNYGISCTILRLFNVYGPGQNLKNMKQGMLKIYLSQMIKDKKLKVKGSLDRFRDFIYIDDVISALFKSMKNKEKLVILNIGSGKKTKVRNLIEILNKELGTKIKSIISKGTPGDQFGIYGTVKKANYKINWKPKINLSTGIKNFIRYIKDNV